MTKTNTKSKVYNFFWINFRIVREGLKNTCKLIKNFNLFDHKTGN